MVQGIECQNQTRIRMQPREYAERLRSHGHSLATIRVLVSLVYKPVAIATIYNWLSPKRRESQRRYMRAYMRRRRAAGLYQTGKPIVDRKRFDMEGPFQ